jgi:hypothetical protein
VFCEEILQRYDAFVKSLAKRYLLHRRQDMLLRFFGYVFLCLAVVALAYDGMRMIADNGQLAFTTLEMHWATIDPDGLQQAREIVESIHVLLWSPLVATILVFPAWIVAVGLASLSYLAGYTPPRSPIPDGI